MKTCSRCRLDKEYEDFPKRLASKDGYAFWCKECKRSVDNEHYKSSPERKAAIRATNEAAVLAKRDWIWTYLSDNPCVDCGESDPVVLEFDHVRGEKAGNVTKIASSGTWESLHLEIQKCDVRCANCHRRVTFQRAGSWRSLFSESGSTFLS